MGDFLFSVIGWLFRALFSELVEEFIRRCWKMLLGVTLFLIAVTVVLNLI